ncbi:hypothetical protein [Streptomyces vastus]|uniref:hypothetical protein n=1 Tax=Streptomyces vastus TaxID=285451 RepID=UPI0031E2F940
MSGAAHHAPIEGANALDRVLTELGPADHVRRWQRTGRPMQSALSGYDPKSWVQ